jgi:hypothetical protein
MQPWPPMHSQLRRLGAWICGSVVLLLAPEAKADPGGPAFRLEADYGILTNTRAYEGSFANGPQALRLSEYRGASAGAFGMRIAGGYVFRPRGIGVFPRMSIAYVPNNQTSLRVRGDLDEYLLQVERRAWSIDVGAELQFFRRQLLVEGALGIASVHSSIRLPGYESVRVSEYYVTPRAASDDSGVLLHLATGWRAPVDFPVTFGVKATAEAVIGTQFFDRAITVPILRAMLSLFVEFEPLFTKDAK